MSGQFKGFCSENAKWNPKFEVSVVGKDVVRVMVKGGRVILKIEKGVLWIKVGEQVVQLRNDDSWNYYFKKHYEFVRAVILLGAIGEVKVDDGMICFDGVRIVFDGKWKWEGMVGECDDMIWFMMEKKLKV